MVTPSQEQAQAKRLFTGNLERLADVPVGARRSALLVALEPHREEILAALSAGHTPHAIARVLVESEEGDDPNVATWSRQAVQRAVARMRDDARTSAAPVSARSTQRRTQATPPVESQSAPRPAAPLVAATVAPSAAPSPAKSAAPVAGPSGFSNVTRRP